MHRGGSVSAPSPIRTQQPRSSGSWCTGFKASEQPANLARTVAIRPARHVARVGAQTPRHLAHRRSVRCYGLASPTLVLPLPACSCTYVGLRHGVPATCVLIPGVQGNCLSCVRNIDKRSEVGVTVRCRVRGVNGTNWNGYREMFKAAFGLPTEQRGRGAWAGRASPCRSAVSGRAGGIGWVSAGRGCRVPVPGARVWVGSLDDLRRHGPSVDGGRTRGRPSPRQRSPFTDEFRAPPRSVLP